jgi:Beta-lactamase enzyme family
MRRFFPAAIVIFMFTHCQQQLKEDNQLLFNMLEQEPDQFRYFLDHKDELEIQIIYTRINRDANNRPEFRSFYFNVDSSCYFYPASTVKLPMVLLSLEKLHQLNIPGLNKFSTMLHDSLYSGQKPKTEDTTSTNCQPSIAHYVKKILLVSDNDAHNRLYEFLGQASANERMLKKGYTIRYLHRLDRPLTPDENRHTEAVRFIYNDSILYSQPMLINDSIVVREQALKGTGFMKNDTLFLKPLDFSYKNFYPLTSQQRLLRALLFPGSVPVSETFDITEDDRKFVLKYMSQLPTETIEPAYSKDSIYYPSYAKYLMFGNDKGPIPSNLRIFNKIGNAYGYMIDNAYIVDFEHHVEFMLSAVIATNTDQIYNDGKYDYERIGFPFMKNLGNLVYRYELSRQRPRKPDLSAFVMDYDKHPAGK